MNTESARADRQMMWPPFPLMFHLSGLRASPGRNPKVLYTTNGCNRVERPMLVAAPAIKDFCNDSKDGERALESADLRQVNERPWARHVADRDLDQRRLVLREVRLERLPRAL